MDPEDETSGMLRSLRLTVKNVPECRAMLRDLGFVPLMVQLVTDFPK